MGKKITFKSIRNRIKRQYWLSGLLIIVIGLGLWVYLGQRSILRTPSDILPISHSHQPAGGKIISQEVIRNYSVEEVNALAKQNYGADTVPAQNAISKRLLKYTSVDTQGQEIDLYARVYLPRTNTSSKIPLISFGPGTTGIGDECAASLEVPALANWANYESHAAAYAGQGYAVVITDYEGMRDSSRLHHYMVGELEGRAVLDAARATFNLGDYKNLDRNRLFLAGYSQGGQAVAWADKIAPSYAPDLKIKGLVAFAPVSDVTTTLADIARGANIVWFGPYVLVSYSDYYDQTFPLNTILQAKWIPTLKTDVLGHCINSVKYWPKAEEVYTPEFLTALKTSTLASSYPDLAADLVANRSWSGPTATPKLINQGQKDNIILPDQQTNALSLLCRAGSGPAKIQTYPDASHYSIMVKSYKDTLAWLTKAQNGEQLPSSCTGV
ncbi:MAG TPA: lipase family protein [Candidatus Saccharimonadales bacterium]|nr:lipase family protein [Candidatus Saccharimonadales bacterium]